MAFVTFDAGGEECVCACPLRLCKPPRTPPKTAAKITMIKPSPKSAQKWALLKPHVLGSLGKGGRAASKALCVIGVIGLTISPPSVECGDTGVR